ncbi:MAG: ABC transporter ATP-binding protein [Clostridia bacterium]|nr:ABC transporter ATP-binding protein [Clostridia bacterium]
MAKKKKTGPQKHTFRRILKYAAPYRKSLVFAMIFAVLYVVLTLTAPVLIGKAIDCAVSEGNVDFGAIAQLLLMTAVTVTGCAVFQWLMALFINSVSYFTIRDIRSDVFAKFNSVPLKYIDGHPHGDLISRIINDTESIGDGMLQGITQLFSGAVMIICTLAFMIMLNFVIALVVVIITPLSMFVAAFITRLSQKQFREQSKTQGEISAYIEEYIGQQKLVKAFGYEDDAQEGFDEINERLLVCGKKSQFYSSLANPSTRFVNGLVTTAVCITGAVSVINGGLTVGQIAAFITYANQYTKPFNEVTGVIPQLQSALAGADRVFEVLDSADQLPDPADPCSTEGCKGRIDIDKISFSYSPDKPLITDFELHVKAGSRIAIVGPTGCGKTTFINLLMRFYDVTSGDIRVDGKSIYDMKRDDLRSLYGMVLQESWLYNASVRDNIAYGKPDATLDEVKTAAGKAFIDRFIERMPDGYDTIITEDGGNLSQGQRQLMCIARVMLCDPPMLILDEATSSIDTRTELKIQEAFNNMMKGRTSFIVAHRLSTIKEADVILVMKDGSIIEQGSHEVLMKKGGFYHDLYNSQFAPVRGTFA